MKPTRMGFMFSKVGCTQTPYQSTSILSPGRVLGPVAREREGLGVAQISSIRVVVCFRVLHTWAASYFNYYLLLHIGKEPTRDVKLRRMSASSRCCTLL